MITRGDIYLTDLNPVKGSEQGGIRPVVIIQNDTGNRFSPTVIVAMITAKMSKSKIPTHVEVKATQEGVVRDSIIMLEQIRTLDKSRLIQKMGTIDMESLSKVNKAISISLDLKYKIR